MSTEADMAKQQTPRTIDLPAPTAWPLVLAFGVALVFAGMATAGAVSVLGAVLALAGAVGWFGVVLPHDEHESVPVLEEVPAVVTTRPEVARRWRSRGPCSRWSSIRSRRE